MAFSIYEYPEYDFEEFLEFMHKIQQGTGLKLYLSPDKTLSGNPCPAHLHFGLKLAVLRKNEPPEKKRKIRAALQSVGFSIAKEEYPDRTMRQVQDEWGSVCSTSEGGESPTGEDTDQELIRSVYLTELRKREGIIYKPVQKLLKILPHNDASVVSCQFVAYDPRRIGVLGWSGYGYPVIREDRVFESFELHNTYGVDPELLEDVLQKMSIGASIATGITSKVVIKNREIRHIPMIDFVDSPHPIYPDDFIDAVKKLELSGIIVSSGKSYHFYGDELQTPAEWEQFLAKLTQEELVDKFWADLQRKQGFSLLRITPCTIKQHFPVLEERIY